MTDYLTAPVGMIVVPEGEPIYSERATRIEVQDESGGLFVEITQTWGPNGTQIIRIDPEDAGNTPGFRIDQVTKFAGKSCRKAVVSEQYGDAKCIDCLPPSKRFSSTHELWGGRRPSHMSALLGARRNDAK